MKVAPELHEAILARAAAGESCASIASWLQSKHAIKVTGEAVRKIVRKHRSDRADVAKVVAREHIAKTLPKDLTAFDAHMEATSNLLRKAQRQADRDLSVANVEKVAKLSAAYQKFDEAKKRAMGLDQPDEVVGGLADLLALAFPADS